MAQQSSIEWTETTWNPVTGCTAISAGCAHCYAKRMAKRLKAMGNPRYRNEFDLTLHHDLITLPLRWKPPHTIFVNSMSDLFHEDVPSDFVRQIFETMGLAHWHQYQILTKRSEHLLQLSPCLSLWPHVWMGVSVESQDCSFRIDHLRQTGAFIKFVSLEPLLGALPELDLRDIDWVIVGGESGPQARAMDPAWVIDLRDQCLATKVPFFFKQWGKLRNNPDPNDPTAKGNGGKAKGGRMLEGRTWDEMPVPRGKSDL